jgi:hypothetical protein
MTRRKGEITGHQNERDFPHIVELPLPSGGFRGQHSEFDAFHRERRLQLRRGEAATRRGSSTSGIASQTPRPRTRSATASAASA